MNFILDCSKPAHPNCHVTPRTSACGSTDGENRLFVWNCYILGSITLLMPS